MAVYKDKWNGYKGDTWRVAVYYSPVQIAERLGHESITITERYSHLYPSVQLEMANRLDKAFVEE